MMEVIYLQKNKEEEEEVENKGGLLGGDNGEQRVIDLVECTSWDNK